MPIIQKFVVFLRDNSEGSRWFVIIISMLEWNCQHESDSLSPFQSNFKWAWHDWQVFKICLYTPSFDLTKKWTWNSPEIHYVWKYYFHYYFHNITWGSLTNELFQLSKNFRVIYKTRPSNFDKAPKSLLGMKDELKKFYDEDEGTISENKLLEISP